MREEEEEPERWFPALGLSPMMDYLRAIITSLPEGQGWFASSSLVTGLGALIEHHAVTALLSPNLGQEVLIVHVPEHEFVVLFARILLLAMRKDGGNGVAVLDLDRGSSEGRP